MHPTEIDEHLPNDDGTTTKGYLPMASKAIFRIIPIVIAGVLLIFAEKWVIPGPVAPAPLPTRPAESLAQGGIWETRDGACILTFPRSASILTQADLSLRGESLNLLADDSRSADRGVVISPDHGRSSGTWSIQFGSQISANDITLVLNIHGKHEILQFTRRTLKK